MLIDIICVLGLLFAFFLGFKKGIVGALFWFVSIMIAIICAAQFSHIAVLYLERWFQVTKQFFPLLAYILIFITVMFIFKLLSSLVESMLKAVSLNIFNRLAGAALFCLAFIMVYSSILFYLKNMKLISETKQTESLTYAYVHAVAPQSIDVLSKAVPFVKNTFNSLQDWFDQKDEQKQQDDMSHA